MLRGNLKIAISVAGLFVVGFGLGMSPLLKLAHLSQTIPNIPDVPAKDFRIELGSHSVEIEGVCSMNESAVLCWKPNGSRNDALTAEVTQVLTKGSSNASQSFQLKFNMKNRLLILKSTDQPYKIGANSVFGNALTNDFISGKEPTEGWKNSNNPFPFVPPQPNQPQVSREVLLGSFLPDTKSYPLRHQLVKSTLQFSTIHFKTGPFTIEGNTYEIVNISDKQANGNFRDNGLMMGTFGGKMIPVKRTYVTFRPVKITNPAIIMNFSPADDSGQPLPGLDETGNVLSKSESQRQTKKLMDALAEAKKTGVQPNFYDPDILPPMHIETMQLDPFQMIRFQPLTKSIECHTNVEPSKIKKLSVNMSYRTNFVFEQIALDPIDTKGTESK